MSIEVKVPVLPESVSDATIATWHKKAGDSVRRDENLLDLETDKVVLEVPSPVDGVIKELKFKAGDTVTSAQVIAIIDRLRHDEGQAGEQMDVMALKSHHFASYSRSQSREATGKARRTG